MILQIIISVVLFAVAIILGWTIRWLYAKFQLSSTEQRAIRILEEAKKEADAQKKEILLEAKEQVIREQKQQEKENRERRSEIQHLERRLLSKEEQLNKKAEATDRLEKELVAKNTRLDERSKALEDVEQKYREELEKISGLTAEQAKQLIIDSLQTEAKRDAQAIISKLEDDAHLTAEKRAQEILVTTIQRLATEVTSDITITSVNLPNDEMKGRIIGREGRNIRSLETLTGVDIIIDDTPEAVVISCFDPIRREIARIALERLILDGRIHPGRIEEIVQKVANEINQVIYEEGEKALFDLGIHNMHPDGIKALGRLYFRSSYGQNVLQHSKEVAVIAGMLASEVDADIEVAKRAALLHDIGKGFATDSDKNHAEIGYELVKRMNESPKVVNAVAAHHNDIEPNCIEAIIVQIADAISAARPGARRETIDNYIKRLQNLEEIAYRFDGVEKVYAIQAGRELRVMINNEKLSDSDTKALGREIAKTIEDELQYPGKIRVTLIRETRIVEYAR
ncbi:MAG: ribonuclease Y [Spirochaetaceae bacterium]|nr:ribonuclease Y [Spirochaetaceae bacterium]